VVDALKPTATFLWLIDAPAQVLAAATYAGILLGIANASLWIGMRVFDWARQWHGLFRWTASVAAGVYIFLVQAFALNHLGVYLVHFGAVSD